MNVTIIIPSRNEEKMIEKCLNSIVDSDYPKEKLEVIVVDGMSKDNTRKIVQSYSEKYSFISILNNPKKIAPTALNIGIKKARGKVIIRMDAHTIYQKDYVSKCMKNLYKYNVDNIGGLSIPIPEKDTIVAKSIAFAYSHLFGVGNTYFRIGLKEPRYVDTVPFGCYKKETFEKIGLFNENLERTQDLEFNYRLKKSGGKILLIPQIISNYYVRSDFISFFKYILINSFWATYPRKFLNYMPVSWRHLVPMVFVLSLIVSGALSMFSLFFFYLFLVISGSYLIMNLFFSFGIALREENVRFLFVLPIFFFTLHVCYGLGSLWGLIRSIGIKKGFETD